jgi:hypothetical protein
MKKRLLLKLGLVALLGAGLFVAWLWWTEPTTGICRVSANRIKIGMTEEEVAALVGLPAGIYVTEPSFMSPSSEAALERLQISPHSFTRVWSGDSGEIVVEFDVSAHVCFVEFLAVETFLDKPRRWLHLD